MGTSLHKVIENFDSIRFDGVDEVPAFCEAICFDGGDMDEVVRFNDESMPVIPPYRVTWAEFQSGNSRLGVLVEKRNEKLWWWCFSRLNRSGEWLMWGVVSTLHGECLSRLDVEVERTDIHARTVMLSLVGSAASLFGVMNCVNVKRISNAPSVALQKARAKKGKKPLFSYWTLDLNLKKYEQGEWQGGTHASPRVHLRRGHISVRQNGPHKGKWWWVQPCIVRGSTPGMVHKDYRLAP